MISFEAGGTGVGSVIFDFDSTLVPCESLEELCRAVPGLDASARREIARITAAGMDGSMSFSESLARRLALARPTRAEVLALGERLARAPTAGAQALVRRLGDRGHEVWIVSGGFEDLLRPVARALGVSEARTHGVRAEWNPDGSLARLSLEDGFTRSKLEGVRSRGLSFGRPAVAVGDGATDLALETEGVVDRFVAYTEHVRREAVVTRATLEAEDMAALGIVLGSLLEGASA
jgi:phosphoserine phosphatase